MELYNILATRGAAPKIYILDNDVSDELKAALKVQGSVTYCTKVISINIKFNLRTFKVLVYLDFGPNYPNENNRTCY